MTIIVVGLVILVIGFVAAKSDPALRAYQTMIKTAGVIVILIGVSIACVVQVEPGQVGVQKLFGKVNDNILESGLNVINPLVKVVIFDVRTENYTMSGVTDEGSKMG
ncbi:MAG: prohibitin family protein, partial [Bacteroidetes bacterium]|nr:prohibitin family protein [Bacteroidota bacterium]